MAYIEHRIVSGKFLEIIRHKYYGNYDELLKSRKKPRNKERKLSTEKQKRKNIENCKLKVKRLMHCNFKNQEDLFLSITFEDKNNITEKIALKRLSNFLRRLKYFRIKKEMVELKYIWCMGLDKKDGLHFHLIINKIGLDDLRRIWEKTECAGRFQVSSLKYDATTGLKETARYFIEDNALRVDDLKKMKVGNDKELDNFNKKLFKKWSCSQKLEKPFVPKGYPKIIKSYEIEEVPREYKLYKTMNYKTIGTDYGLYQHIELIRISKMRN